MGVIRGGSPRAVQQLHAPEFVECEAAPVSRRSCGLQTAFAFSPILIAKHAKLSILVPAEPVRTKQTVAILIKQPRWAVGPLPQSAQPGKLPPAATNRSLP